MNLDSLRPGQRAAVQHLEGPLLICAGAGSGKTFTLTQRIVYALSSDSGPYLGSIDEALIITFTNKAAGEIKDRVRSALRAAGMADEALRVDDAWISTIHGMCSRILREHALELGIDPAFELAMGTVCDEALDGALTQVIGAARGEDSEDGAGDRWPGAPARPAGATAGGALAGGRFRALFDTYGADRVRKMVEHLIAQAGYQTAGLDAVDAGPAPRDAHEMLRGLIGACELVAEVGTPTNQEAAAQLLEDLLIAAEEGVAGASMQKGTEETCMHERLAGVLAGVKTVKLGGKKAAPLRDAVKAARAECAFATSRPLMGELVALAREVEGRYRAALAAQGLIDTGDLIRTTLVAFREHPEIAREYSQRFRLIMVDEFQDTSQLQIDMIESIAGPARAHLCTVGDSQQSIYRFQGADVAVYLRHKADMAAAEPVPARREELDTNFRSHGDVLAFVRRVCGRPGYFQEDFLDLQAATEGRVWKGRGPRIELALTSYGGGAGQSEAAARAEAAHIARRFAELAAAGHEPGDMVLLMGATTGSDIYAQAIRDAGLPCVVAGGSRFFDGPHVRECLALLGALANPYDSENLLAVLTGEALPVSPDDLLALSTRMSEQTGLPTRQNPAVALLFDQMGTTTQGVCQGDGSFDTFRAEGRDATTEVGLCVSNEPSPWHTLSPAARHAVRVLRRAWAALGRVRPAEAFMQVVVESGWLARLEAGGPEGQAKAADVLKFARLVEEASAGGVGVVRAHAQLLAQARTGKEKPGALSADGPSAVRIMTVHASKGLEFPIVAVANCYTVRAGGEAPATAAEDGRLFTALAPTNFKDWMPVEPGPGALSQTKGAAEFASLIRETNARREYEERKRLFYVAATRASDCLIVGVKHRLTKDGGYKQVEADLLAGLCPGAEDFPADDAALDYGGSEPARFVRVPLEEPAGETEGEASATHGNPAALAVGASTAADAPAAEGEIFATHDDPVGALYRAPGAGGNDLQDDAALAADTLAAAEAPVADAPLLLIPILDDASPAPLQPLPLRQGFFSYTSLAAEHDAAAPVAPAASENSPVDAAFQLDGQEAFTRAATDAPRDADKATSFGSALHQACEWLALQPADPAPDEPAREVAIARFARAWGVRDLDRLRAAFNRWRASDVRAQAFAKAYRQPELPFALAVAGGVLEGEIDLLAWDDASCATIVDYKTGGHADESPEALHEKHLLQAQCYALAAMEGGFEAVEARFVRVEQPDPARPDQPQVVAYRFTREDIPVLRATVESARA